MWTRTLGMPGCHRRALVARPRRHSGAGAAAWAKRTRHRPVLVTVVAAVGRSHRRSVPGRFGRPLVQLLPYPPLPSLRVPTARTSSRWVCSRSSDSGRRAVGAAADQRAEVVTQRPRPPPKRWPLPAEGDTRRGGRRCATHWRTRRDWPDVDSSRAIRWHGHRRALARSTPVSTARAWGHGDAARGADLPVSPGCTPAIVLLPTLSQTPRRAAPPWRSATSGRRRRRSPSNGRE
jgi:hypothetical protein